MGGTSPSPPPPLPRSCAARGADETGAAGIEGAGGMTGAPGIGGSSDAGTGDADTLPPVFITSTYLCLGPRPLAIRKPEADGGGAGASPLDAEDAIEGAAGSGADAAEGAAAGFGIDIALGGGGGRDSSSPSGLLLSTHRFFSSSQTI